jgi:Protein of unknown function (DUF2612)
MSDPIAPSFYPPVPPNDIGEFVIGESQIGPLPFDWKQTIYSQYANSSTMLALLDAFASNIDPTANLSAFYDLVWNLDTAQGYGLDVWGRIVGVQRQLQVSTSDYFGFQQQLPDITTWGFGAFFNGEAVTSNFTLTDQAFRQLIIAKALANICDGSIAAINQVLLTLFKGRGDCWVQDGLNMTMTYTFAFTLSAVDVAIISQSGVLPRSTGVSTSLTVV